MDLREKYGKQCNNYGDYMLLLACDIKVGTQVGK